MTSPSISSTSRNTPCAAGCCGPKFMVRLRISGTGAPRSTGTRSGGERGLVTIVVANHARHQGARFDSDRLVDDALEFRVITHFDISDQREVLAERVPDKPVVGQQPAQVRVPAKQYAVQIKGLALE